MAIPKEVRWDPSNVMGSSCPINMVTGPRTLGKTYGMKKQGIRRFIERGETWAYVRYNDAMVKRIMKAPEHFLADIAKNDEFPHHMLRMEGLKMQIAEKANKPKWTTFGTIYSLTSFDSYKGTTTPNMSLMVLDEFIKEKRFPPYPPDCVNMLMNMWETFDRREDRVKIVMLANAADLVNPFFRAWNIQPIPKGTTRKFRVGKSHVLYENAWSEAFAKFSADTNIGSFTDGTDYADYALNNEFKNDSGLFVQEKPKTAKCQMCIVWRNTKFGVWPDGFTGDVYVNTKPTNDVNQLVLTRSDMTPDYMMIDRTSPYLKYPLKAFQCGQLYFDKDSTRENFLDMLQLCGLH